MGRRNWLFICSEAGAQASANIYSVLITAKANGIEPYKYLENIIANLPHWPEAHSMVMCPSLQDNGGWLLQGSEKAYDALLRDLDMEIEEEIGVKKNLPTLRRIRKYITPEGDDFSGW